mmetsp:Transcript_32088/g.76270  ORF Transcript_32088/g.76270 Transcript_32088/m.76270 type:complete len:206 (+) Transcript_32088:272-889(+)
MSGRWSGSCARRTTRSALSAASATPSSHLSEHRRPALRRLGPQRHPMASALAASCSRGAGQRTAPSRRLGPRKALPRPEEPPAIPAKAETLRERGARGRGSWTGSRTSSALRSPSLRTMASDSWQGGNSDVANPGVNSSLKSPGLQPRRLECLQGFNSDCSVPVCREGSFWAGAKVICIIHQARRGVYSEAVAVSQVDTRYELSS